MKCVFRFCVLSLLIFTVGFQTVNACTITVEPLRKHFRRANAVFLAEVVEIRQKPGAAESKNFISDDVTFDISETWKGDHRNRATLPASSGFICGCDSKPSRFETGRKYVVFLNNENVADICDSEPVETGGTPKTVERLDRFWFRAWARIYPF
ncbi:MAG TPA: hypothetical protein VIL74_06630 [Pyrinomonadaceae bacterium]|jgi:hypothetical protein